jgi:hypothetical protein
MIIKTWNTTQEAAESYWKHRWAIYVIKAERRLPRAWVQRLRLGQLTYDPVSDKRVHRCGAAEIVLVITCWCSVC